MQTSDSDWMQSVVKFTAPATAKNVTIFHLINGVGWLQTDDFSLIDESLTTPPAPPVVPPVTSTNLVPNPSVETPDSANPTKPQNWTNAKTGTNTTAFNYLNTGHSGGRSVQVQMTKRSSGNAKWYFNPVNVSPNTAYKFSDWYQSSVATHYQVVVTRTNGKTVNVASGSVAKSTAWKQLSVSFTTPADAKSVTVYHYLNKVGQLTTDDFDLEGPAQPTPPPASNNLIINPSVENSSDSSKPDSWSSGSWGSNSSIFSYLATGRTGSHSIKVETSSYVNGAASWSYDKIPVTPGKTYHYENWYKSDVDTEVDAEVIMSDGSTQYFWLGSVSSSNDWSKFSTSFTTPSGAKSVAIYQILAKNGFVITDDYSLGEYVPTAFSRALVSVTLDDGWASQYQNALPILNKYGLKATYYIITGSLGEQPYYMSTDQVKNLYLQGMEIGSHTITHPDLTKVTQSQLVNEMSQSQTTLQNAIGAPVLNFAYPYGAYNSGTVSVGKQYYNSQRSVDQGLNTKDNLDLTRIKIYEVDNDISQVQVQSWIDSAIAERAWLVLVYHEVGSDFGGGKYHVDSSEFDSQMSYLKNTGVATVTVSQAISELSTQL
jgi:peptidoglycan/xylan/chitin deacetylase (PgdA/CDA1 family)